MKLLFEKFHDEIFKTIMEKKVAIRKFETGATRDTDIGKLDFEGFLSPIVLKKYAEYMYKHRKQSDGKLRDSDNWQKGFGKGREHFVNVMKSWFRHFFNVWFLHRGFKGKECMGDALLASLFNNMSYAHQYFKNEELQKEMTKEQMSILMERNK